MKAPAAGTTVEATCALGEMTAEEYCGDAGGRARDALAEAEEGREEEEAKKGFLGFFVRSLPLFPRHCSIMKTARGVLAPASPAFFLLLYS